MVRVPRASALLPLLLFTRCSCEEGGTLPVPAEPAVVRLVVRPASAELVTDGVVPATQAFTAVATYEDAKEEDVTARALWTLSDAAVGTIAGGLFTSSLSGGEAVVQASLQTRSATAAVKVSLERVIVVNPPGTPMVPQNPGGPFGGPSDPQRAPELVYPNDGTMLPPNLGAVEVHYRRGSRDNSLFEIGFTSPTARVLVYTRCDPLGAGCVYETDAAVWAALQAQAGLEPVQITVRGTDDAGTAVGQSARAGVNIAARPVFGGLYYWTTSGGTGIMRVDFGDPNRRVERFFPFQGGGCYGCHALSRNGRRMSLSQNGIGDGRLTLLDVAGRQVLLSGEDGKREQFQSWNPTSDRFAGVWADSDPPDTQIRIRDGNTGEVVERIDLGFEPDHPDWSPRGDRILFTKVTRNEVSQRPGRGGIGYVEAQSGGGWSAPRELVAPEDGKNRYYPAYSPDGAVLVYDESTCPGGGIYHGDCDGDADPSGTLWALSADGGAPVKLAQANAPGVEDRGRTELSNTFPKWAPFVDAARRDGTGRLMWMTFSSRRQYGLRAPDGTGQLLWMVAIDPDALLAGRDGSYAAYALPFQDLATSNHIAQWTATITPMSSDGGFDPLADGSSCLGIGEICNPAADLCCGGTRCEANGPGIFLCRPQF